MPSGAGLGLTKILCRRGFSVPESEEGNREVFPTARGKWAGGGKGGLSAGGSTDLEGEITSTKI